MVASKAWIFHKATKEIIYEKDYSFAPTQSDVMADYLGEVSVVILVNEPEVNDET